MKILPPLVTPSDEEPIATGGWCFCGTEELARVNESNGLNGLSESNELNALHGLHPVLLRPLYLFSLFDQFNAFDPVPDSTSASNEA